MINRVRLLAWFYIVMCGGFMVVGLVVCLGLLLSGDPSSRRALEVLGWGFFWLSVAYFIPGFLGGLGLLRGRRWARVLIIILSALVLLGFPIGTVIGGYGLWVLLESGDKQRPNEPAGADHAAPSAAPRMSPEERRRYQEFLVIAAGVASLMVIVIGTGYKVTRTPGSPIHDGVYFGAIGLLATVIGLAVRAHWMRNNPPLAVSRAYWEDVRRRTEDQRREQEERHRRLAILRADHVRQTYAERIERGETWSDEQIEYDLDPATLATCDHLKPIEHEMRTLGFTMRLEAGSTVRARCRIAPDILRARPGLASSVAYAEPTPQNVDFDAPLPAQVTCRACNSAIVVVHPQDAIDETPMFPLGASSLDASRTSDPPNRVAEFRREILALARRLGATSDAIPSYRWSYGNGLPHIEIDEDTYYYVLEERGQEFERFATKSLDEILYKVTVDLSFNVALKQTRNGDNPGADYRRALFPAQLELLGRINPDWRARCATEQQETLAKHPFVDDRSA